MKQVYDAVPREDGGWKIVLRTLPQESEQAIKFVMPKQADNVNVYTPPLIRPSTHQADESTPPSKG